MTQEYVFRFVSLRPANAQKKRERAAAKAPLYPKEAGETELRGALQRAHASGADRATVSRIVEEFRRGQQYVRSIDALPLDLSAGLEWVQANVALHPGDEAVRAGLQTLYGAPPEKLVNSQPFRETLACLADTVMAETLARGDAEALPDELTAAHKLVLLILDVAGRVSFPEGQTVGDLVAARTLVVPRFGRLPEEKVELPPQPDPTPDPGGPERDRIRRRITDLEEAHREISTLAANPRAILKASQRASEDVRISALERRLSSVELQSRAGEAAKRIEKIGAPGGSLGQGGGLVLTLRSVESMSEASRRVVDELKLDRRGINPITAVGLIERELNLLGAQLASTEAPGHFLMIGGARIDVGVLKDSLGIKPGIKLPPALITEKCDFQAGIGDLLLVRQTLKAYELAEFAHVENVLAGESREREHRRLNVREEFEISEEERETEKERNLQSTERNEMQAEAEKTVKSQFGLEAGLQVSGSYGPTVSFSASLNASFSTTTEETQRKSVSYSREVTDKTSERVRERVRRELRRRLLEETQEINRHSVNNSNAANGHIRGIYRWLNKVYDAQIFNYGQRMMYEFVVPEPAAYFLYAMVENPPQENELVKPEPPTHFGAPLKPSHITRTNYHDWVATYQVRNVPPPPPEFQHAAYFDKQDKVQDGSNFGRSGKIEVPAGYEAYGASVMGDFAFTEGDDHTFRIMLGNTNFDRSNVWGAGYQSLDTRYRELSVAYHLFHVWSFALGIDVYCRLTAEGYAKWKQQVYDAIVEAYLVQRAEYEEKVAALAIQKGIPILGRNPLENRRIERDELKKLVLMMLTGSNSIAQNSFYSASEPTMRLDRACENGSRIRFFENAFEWNNLLYVFYPYFWGRKPRWATALHLSDPDPDFAAFLKAGAARVQVPVRPGFERAVAHFCQFGEIWEGNDAPLRDDDLYVPIVDEIAANLGKLDEGVPYPPDSGPWEVRIPTSLVLLQNMEEIPAIRDMLTGNVVGL
ncbi:MAG: hypothetical protein RLZZ387_836 [Chloroflexota bacterium]